MTTFALARPSLEALPSYVAALNRGWSPDNIRGPVASAEQLAKIAADPAAFVDGLEDLEAKGGPISLPDGGKAERLPGFVRWMWDGEFCGSVGFRWRPGTAELPSHVLGHAGYAVPPWKRCQGYATRGLGLLLPEVRALGLPWIDLTTDVNNVPSQRVILSNGGRLLGRFTKPAAYGGGEGLRFRIEL